MQIYLVDAEHLDQDSLREATDRTVSRHFDGQNYVRHFLVSHKLNLNNLSQEVATLRARLQDFDPERHYLILVGRSLPNFLIGYILGSLGHRRINLLFINHKRKVYNPLTVELPS